MEALDHKQVFVGYPVTWDCKAVWSCGCNKDSRAAGFSAARLFLLGLVEQTSPRFTQLRCLQVSRQMNHRELKGESYDLSMCALCLRDRLWRTNFL
jgi:hypothetical protein